MKLTMEQIELLVGLAFSIFALIRAFWSKHPKKPQQVAKDVAYRDTHILHLFHADRCSLEDISYRTGVPLDQVWHILNTGWKSVGEDVRAHWASKWKRDDMIMATRACVGWESDRYIPDRAYEVGVNGVLSKVKDGKPVDVVDIRMGGWGYPSDFVRVPGTIVPPKPQSQA